MCLCVIYGSCVLQSKCLVLRETILPVMSAIKRVETCVSRVVNLHHSFHPGDVSPLLARV